MLSHGSGTAQQDSTSTHLQQLLGPDRDELCSDLCVATCAVTLLPDGTVLRGKTLDVVPGGIHKLHSQHSQGAPGASHMCQRCQLVGPAARRHGWGHSREVGVLHARHWRCCCSVWLRRSLKSCKTKQVCCMAAVAPKSGRTGAAQLTTVAGSGSNCSRGSPPSSTTAAVPHLTQLALSVVLVCQCAQAAQVHGSGRLHIKDRISQVVVGAGCAKGAPAAKLDAVSISPVWGCWESQLGQRKTQGCDGGGSVSGGVLGEISRQAGVCIRNKQQPVAGRCVNSVKVTCCPAAA